MSAAPVAAGVATVATVVNALAKLSLSEMEQRALRDVQKKLDTLMRICEEMKSFAKSLELIYADIQAIMDKYIFKMDQLARATGNKLDDKMRENIKAQVQLALYNDVKVHLPPSMEQMSFKIVSTVFGATMATAYRLAKVS